RRPQLRRDQPRAGDAPRVGDRRAQARERRVGAVSASFFDFFDARPALGRFFAPEEDAGEVPAGVISYAWWQRRFGGHPDVVGRTVKIRNTSLVIVGVAAPDFIGESNGLPQDIWVPMRLQPRVLPGVDWLHEQPPDKMMWLHVFGRLKPGVTQAQAEAQANSILQTNLKAFYGEAATTSNADLLDQRVTLYPGARGMSATVDQFTTSIAILVVALVILLLIACGNLANIALARAASRHIEMAIRASLGATRASLVRQLLVESFLIAAIGGTASIVVTSLAHRGLVSMLRQSEPGLLIEFSLDPMVVSFAIVAALVAALIIGLLPAWHLSRGVSGARHGNEYLRAVSSPREVRTGRWLVCGQLALSLPLLVVAGLLVQSLSNLRHPVLGFESEKLMLAQINIGELVQTPGRRDRVLREIQTGLRQLPNVETTSYSQLGIFGGGMSTAAIEIDGRATADGREVALDRVGADYFAALGISIRAGRDIRESDSATSQPVCVINEAFSRRFFAGRDPIGRRVSTIEPDGSRVAHQIVGIAADAHTHGLRRAVEPRFFVPAEQRRSLSNGRTFLIRTRTADASLASLVRDSVESVDPATTLVSLTDMNQEVEEQTTEDRTVAVLAFVFAGVAVALAAIGLYGVLSFAVARRRREIAVRMALGAWSRHIVTLILRENVRLAVAGLSAGGVFTYFASRLIGARLYGVTGYDPLTLSAAVALLLLVAGIAAFVPARRAARLDPLTALRNG
ncbi:MAG TPA: ADOP family duplicated permease, partial [Vicinamibacterales bacterium]|nr:ADOP family duplicated permease [Vicinamibacterales bacterium]